ncbi:MAG: hypothetical protein R3A47_05110 [Polyangiales bacterium]
MLVAGGREFFGATSPSSYHDVLRYAGLDDIAANKYARTPKLNFASILKLNPEWIVTDTESARTICETSPLDTLRACRTSQIIAVPSALLGAADEAMIDAAKFVKNTIDEK